MTLAMAVLLLQFPALNASARTVRYSISATHVDPSASASAERAPELGSLLSRRFPQLHLNFAATQPTNPGEAHPKPADAAAPIIHKPLILPTESVNTLTGPTTSESFLPSPTGFRPPYELPVTHRWWMALSTAEHSAAAYDAWSTRKALSDGRVEADPLMRPFAGSAAIYPAIQVIPFGLDYLARNLQRSSGWAHHIWWLPQSAATVTFLFSGSYNVAHTN